MSLYWEVRTAGSDSNGGGFDSSLGGTDYSQQNSAQATGTGTSASTTLTATTGIFTSQMVGNYVTNGTTWYKITAYTSSTIVTLSGSPSWTAQTIKVGGALATPGLAAAQNNIYGGDIYIKTGTYSVTSTSFNVSSGCIQIWYGTKMIGYGTTRGDTGRATIQLNVASATMLQEGNISHGFENIIFDGNSQSSSGFITNDGNDRGYFFNCDIKNFTANTFGGATYEACYVSGNSYAIAGNFYDCVITGSASDGCSGSIIRCVVYGNSGIGYNGYASVIDCVIFNNTSHGIQFNNGSSAVEVRNTIISSNGGYGINISGTIQGLVTVNCAYYSNTSGKYSTGANITRVIGEVTLSGDPFTNTSGGDFSLNTTAGAGAACRAAGSPGVMPGGSTTGYLDIGVAQHQDSGGGTTVGMIF